MFSATSEAENIKCRISSNGGSYDATCFIAV